MQELINTGALAMATPFTQQTADQLAEAVLSLWRDGQMYAGEALAIAKLFETVAKQIAEATKDTAQEWQGRGATVAITGRANYDYSTTPAWAQLQAQIEAIKAQQKQIEQEAQRLAKAGHGRGAIVDAEGEIIEVAPALATYSTVVTTKLSKA